MPDQPTIGGTFRIRSKKTGKWLALPEPGEYQILGGLGYSEVYTKMHIVPRDQGRGVVWRIEDVFTEQGAAYRFYTRGLFPWFEELLHVSGEDPEAGRLDSNHDRQVYAHKLNDSPHQMWLPQPMGDGYWRLHNIATGFALDGNWEDIHTQRPNDGDYQRWGFYRASPEDWPV